MPAVAMSDDSRGLIARFRHFWQADVCKWPGFLKNCVFARETLNRKVEQYASKGDLKKQGFGVLLSWFESWRMQKGQRADRPAEVLFWREQVVVKPRRLKPV